MNTPYVLWHKRPSAFLLLLLLLAAGGARVCAQRCAHFVVRLPQGMPLPELSDTALLRKAVAVHFAQDKTNLSPTDTGYIALTREVLRLRRAGYTRFRLMLLRGSASPEGPTAHNHWLARQRAAVLHDSISLYAGRDVPVKLSYVDEDYTLLRILVERSDYLFRDLVLSTLHAHPDDPKEALRGLRGGSVWFQLMERFYPHLRAARVVLFVEDKDLPGQVPPLPLQFPPHAQDTPLRPVPDYVALLPPMPDPLATPSPAPERHDSTGQKPMWNIKTNLLFDLGMTPNGAVEFLPPFGHFTLMAEWDGAGWRNDNKQHTWILANAHLEARFYLKGRAAFTGHYFNAYGHAGHFDIQFSAKSAYLSPHFGHTWGAGLGWGYVRRFGRSRWKWEVNVGVGYLYSTYDCYHPAEEWAVPGQYYYNYHGNPALFRTEQRVLRFFGPTRLGFTISYDLPWITWR